MKTYTVSMTIMDMAVEAESEQDAEEQALHTVTTEPYDYIKVSATESEGGYVPPGGAYLVGERPGETIIPHTASGMLKGHSPTEPPCDT